METIFNTLGEQENKEEKSFRTVTGLLLLVVLIGLNFVAGFITDSMAVTASVGYYLATIFILGDSVVFDLMPKTKPVSIMRLVISVMNSLVVVLFAAIVINEFVDRVASPMVFSEKKGWLMLIASVLSALLWVAYSRFQKTAKFDFIVPTVVFASTLTMKVAGVDAVDSYCGLIVSLLVIFVAFKMMVKVWKQKRF